MPDGVDAKRGRAPAVRPGDLLPTVAYRIDDRDVVTWVNDEFSAFAENSGAADLVGRVVGRPIWNFLDGDVVRHVYRILFERVRGRDLIVWIPLRCDSPDQARAGHLQIVALPDGAIEIQSRLRAGRPRSPLQLIDPTAPRDEQAFLKMCAWCKRVEDSGRGLWRDPEEAVLDLRLFERETMPRITHGICPRCEGMLVASV